MDLHDESKACGHKLGDAGADFVGIFCWATVKIFFEIYSRKDKMSWNCVSTDSENSSKCNTVTYLFLPKQVEWFIFFVLGNTFSVNSTLDISGSPKVNVQNNKLYVQEIQILVKLFLVLEKNTYDRLIESVWSYCSDVFLSV